VSDTAVFVVAYVVLLVAGIIAEVYTRRSR